MTASTPRRITKMLVLGAIGACAAAPAAGAMPIRDAASAPTSAYLGSPPDVRDTAAAVSQSTSPGVVADGLRLQAIAQAYQSNAKALSVDADGLRMQAIANAYQESRPVSVPDAVDRYIAAHPNGPGATPAIQSTLVSRPPDVADAALSRTASWNPGDDTIATEAVRPPDVRDAAEVARWSVPSQPSGFDWSDYSIGLGSGMGLVALLVGGLTVGLQHRRRAQTA
jgi:hypothetical protein